MDLLGFFAFFSPGINAVKLIISFVVKHFGHLMLQSCWIPSCFMRSLPGFWPQNRLCLRQKGLSVDWVWAEESRVGKLLHHRSFLFGWINFRLFLLRDVVLFCGYHRFAWNLFSEIYHRLTYYAVMLCYIGFQAISCNRLQYV